MVLGLGVFLGALFAGRWLHLRGRFTGDQAARMVRWIVTVPSPISLCLSFWRMNFRSPEPWVLPVIGFLVASSALIPAYLYVRRSALTRPQAGSFLAAAYFSNLGYFGAFTAFALYGEAAYALAMLYLIFFTPAFYTLGFTIAARYGQAPHPSVLERAFKGELRLYPFLGMAAGAALSLAGIPRPTVLEALNHLLIPVTTAAYLATIGTQIGFSSPRRWLGPCLAMSAIKFLYTPAVAWLLMNLFGIEGIARAVIIIEASTPVGVSSLVLPLLFGLDRQHANALWLFTTVVAVPWFVMLLPLLPRL
jgi:predicted permease